MTWTSFSERLEIADGNQGKGCAHEPAHREGAAPHDQRGDNEHRAPVRSRRLQEQNPARHAGAHRADASRAQRLPERLERVLGRAAQPHWHDHDTLAQLREPPRDLAPRLQPLRHHDSGDAGQSPAGKGLRPRRGERLWHGGPRARHSPAVPHHELPPEVRDRDAHAGRSARRLHERDRPLGPRELDLCQALRLHGERRVSPAGAAPERLPGH